MAQPDTILTPEKLERYFAVTTAAKEKVEQLNSEKIATDLQAQDMFDMICNYISDAHHFYDNGDWVNAFAALNYAHGWLDAGARLKIFDVQGDSVLFTVDEEF